MSIQSHCKGLAHFPSTQVATENKTAHCASHRKVKQLIIIRLMLCKLSRKTEWFYEQLQFRSDWVQ